MDPREARLVLHGWFTDPKPFLAGALSARQAAPVLDEAVETVVAGIADLGQWHGVLSLRILVAASGAVTGVEILADTLVPVAGDPAGGGRIRNLARRKFESLRFPRAKGKSSITLPLLFR